MTAPVIIDFIAAGVLVLSALLGAKRGLFRTLSGLVMILLALVGANLIAGALSAPAARVLAPAVERRIEARVDEAVRDRDSLHESGGSDLDAVLDALGLDSKLRSSLAESAQEMIRDVLFNLASVSVSILSPNRHNPEASRCFRSRWMRAAAQYTEKWSLETRSDW